MSNFPTLKREYGAIVDALNEALRRGDEAALLAGLDDIVRLREPNRIAEIRKLTDDLHKALERFNIESRLADIAEHDIPGARARLMHVINMTGEAAHHTLDLVERSGPLAERTAREAGALLDALQAFHERPVAGFETMARALEVFLPAARTDCEQIRRNLADVLLAQGYQDLTGQIIRSVIKLVEELEHTLGSLTALSGDTVQPATPTERAGAVFGPVVPGLTEGPVATAQTDVDALLSDLGM